VPLVNNLGGFSARSDAVFG